MNLNADEFRAKLDAMREKLREARDKRPHPHCDDKVLTNWNALMTRSLAWGYLHLNDERYKEAAERAAEFLWTKMHKPDGTLWHSYRNGVAKVDGILDGYAFLLVALVDLHTVTGDGKWLDRAKTLADTMVELFWDEQEGGFWFTAAEGALIARSKNALDGSEPSGNGMATLGLLRLANKTGDERYAQIAKRTTETFGGLMMRALQGAMTLLCALDEWVTTRKEAVQVAEQPLRQMWAEPERLTIRAGQTALLKVHIALAKGWHINRYEPQPNLLPTQLSGNAKLVAIEQVEFPPTKEVGLKFSDEPLRVYEGTVTVTVWVKANEKAQGEDKLTLRLRYQACDDRRCLAPTEKELHVPVVVAP